MTTGRIILVIFILVAIVALTMGVAFIGGELFGPKQQSQTVSTNCEGFIVIGCNATATINPLRNVDPIMFTGILCLIGAGVLYLISKTIN